MTARAVESRTFEQRSSDAGRRRACASLTHRTGRSVNHMERYLRNSRIISAAVTFS